ncbi:TIGR03084 family metal-binding protein [Gordonia sp. HY002]|uniref:TIGR03084 family metal-binding protein n=1 Tax=Gordonia zhenghanii TaxID=2911516 RepID=UPI001EF073CD|nr:TIGR03084 family metal-binding protein [Gordonia zhenghanii]MCF8570149.1 TIGR03084 family metal-binding protein [Gordonia zhenghanii]MCF8606720.1 TIGR03084 family metal-binding protein [Gordonia zhenghanii]
MTIADDLRAEYTALDDLVADLPAAEWTRPTPAVGWTIAHQVGHVLWTDRVSLIAATDSDRFASDVLAVGVQDTSGFVDAAAEVEASRAPAELLADWRETRTALVGALVAVPDGVRLPWFGPPMSAPSMMTARIMETWAHGLDVADALGVDVEPTDRLRNVAHIGVRTRDFAYVVNGRTPPVEPFRVELTGPSGELWTWGPGDAANIVRGTALHFAELVTQRRALADLDLEFVGDDAAQWASIAQCFAGPPGSGRASVKEGH